MLQATFHLTWNSTICPLNYHVRWTSGNLLLLFIDFLVSKSRKIWIHHSYQCLSSSFAMFGKFAYLGHIVGRWSNFLWFEPPILKQNELRGRYKVKQTNKTCYICTFKRTTNENDIFLLLPKKEEGLEKSIIFNFVCIIPLAVLRFLAFKYEPKFLIKI